MHCFSPFSMGLKLWMWISEFFEPLGSDLLTLVLRRRSMQNVNKGVMMRRYPKEFGYISFPFSFPYREIYGLFLPAAWPNCPIFRSQIAVGASKEKVAYQSRLICGD